MLNLLAAGNPIEHVQSHDLFNIGAFHFNNHMLMATVAGVLMLLIFPRLFRRPIVDAPTGAANFFESILEFLRVEVFRPALKEHADRFVPFLWTLFFFILFCNLLGAIPTADVGVVGQWMLVKIGLVSHPSKAWTELGGTATGNINTTAVLAICAFAFIHINGISQVFRALVQGTYGHHPPHEEHSSNGEPGHETAVDLEHMRGEGLAADVPQQFKAMANPTRHYADDEHAQHTHHAAAAHQASQGVSAIQAMVLAVPLYLWNFAPHPFRPQPGQSKRGWFADVPIWGMLLILELMGALIKPFALCMRLFANMIAGHLVLGVLIGMIVVFSAALQPVIGLPVTALSIMIWVLEIFVSFLQAYIFVFLTTLFIASAVAPEH